MSNGNLRYGGIGPYEVRLKGQRERFEGDVDEIDWGLTFAAILPKDYNPQEPIKAKISMPGKVVKSPETLAEELERRARELKARAMAPAFFVSDLRFSGRLPRDLSLTTLVTAGSDGMTYRPGKTTHAHHHDERFYNPGRIQGLFGVAYEDVEADDVADSIEYITEHLE